jgi:hypothetical protein
MNAQNTSNVVEIKREPILIEVRTDRLWNLMAALYNDGFAIKSVRGTENRYRIEDREVKRPKA